MFVPTPHRRRRYQRGLALRDLVTILGYTEGYWSRLERGLIKIKEAEAKLREFLDRAEKAAS